MPIQSINPATGVLLRSFTPLTGEALLEKIALAESAFARAAEVPLAHRALCMNKLAHLLDRESADLAALITSEMGKPIAQSRAEIAKCAAACRFYAGNAARILAPEPVDARPSTPPSAGTRSASSSPSCPGTSPSGRSSASSHPP